MTGLNLGNVTAHLRLDSTQFDAGIKKAKISLKGFAQGMGKVGRAWQRNISMPLGLAGIAGVKAFASFDDAMVKSLAIMRDVGEGTRAEMEKTAEELSYKWPVAAAEAARGYFYLASAGLNAAQAMKSLPVVTEFAVAGSFELAEATSLAMDALSALGKRVEDPIQNMKNLTEVTDILVGANTLANATTKQFAIALTRQAGPAMKNYGVELKDGMAILATYAEQGMKAELAGTMFGRMLRLMTKGFRKNGAEWQRFGLNIYNAKNELKPMGVIMEEMSVAMAKLSPRARMGALEAMGFQARSMQTILPLLGKQDRIKHFLKLLDDMKGKAKEVAELNRTSFAASLKIMRNDLVAVGRSIGRTLAPAILKIGQLLVRFRKWWMELDESTKKFIVTIGVVLVVIGPVLVLISKLLFVILFLKAAFLFLTPAIGGSAVILSIFAKGLAALTVAIVAFNLGKYLADQFLTVRLAGVTLLEWMTNNFLRLGYFLTQVFTGVHVAWDTVQNGIMKGISWVILKVAKMAGVLQDLLNKIKPGEDIDLGVTSMEQLATNLVENPKTGGLDAWKKNKEIYDKARAMSEEFYQQVRDGVGEQWMNDKEADKHKKQIESIGDQYEKAQKQLEALYEEGPLVGSVYDEFRALEDELAMVGMIASEQQKVAKFIKFKSLVENEYAGDLMMINKLTEDYIVLLEKVAEKDRGIGALKVELKQWAYDASNWMKNLGQVMVNAFDGAADALTEFVTTGKADFNSLANSILADMSRMIIRAQMATAMKSMFPTWFGGQDVGTLAAMVAHSGGTVGSIATRRTVPVGTFAGAPRLHNGLASDEYPAILQRGEEVIPKDGAKSSDRVVTVNVNAIDGANAFQFLSRNKKTLASLLQGSLRQNHPVRKGMRNG